MAVLPAGDLATRLSVAAGSAGAVVTSDPAGADAIIWCMPQPRGLDRILAEAGTARWVQLPFAGVESFLPLMDAERTWTCAKDIYGANVAELALGLLITAFRRLDRYSRAVHWERLGQRSLEDSEVLVLGAGGIGASLTALLVRLHARVTVVSRSGRPVVGAVARKSEELDVVLPTADAVVLALPLTSQTRHLVDASFLGKMKPSAWLVNVARGQVVVTDDLIEALRRGGIAGAALDVTDPEPLPDGHPLWELENVLITPHVANTEEVGLSALSGLVSDNCHRFAAGQPLRGVVDVTAGY